MNLPLALPLREAETITCWLDDWRCGDMQARNRVFETLYKELLAIASSRFSGNAGNHTLQPAALVGELLLRLDGQGQVYHNRSHFLALASLKIQAMLIDHARARNAVKRGRDYNEQVALTVAMDLGGFVEQELDALAVKQALEQLTQIDMRAACVVQLSYFAGLRREEIARVLDVSVPTIDRDLRFAKAWLNKCLAG